MYFVNIIRCRKGLFFMARKLTKEELEKCKADFDIPQGLKPRYKAAEQAKVSRSTLKKGKAARAACDSPKEKHVGRPRTNPEGTRVFGLRVTCGERYMIKRILEYTRKFDGEPCFVIRVVGEPNIEELRITRFADDY